MPLLNDMLSVWEIAFRWSGRDPDKLWFRLPLPVRDNFRLMMNAILNGDLVCETLSLERRRRDSETPPEFFIRHHIDDVYHCIAGLQFKRKLLRHAMIERWAMHQWCTTQNIPLPEFWFPPGWKLHFEWPYSETDDQPADTPSPETTTASLPESVSEQATPHAKPQQVAAQPEPMTGREEEAEGRRKLDRRQRARIACQEIAARLWRDQPTADVKTIANTREVQAIAGGEEYDFEVVRRWIAEIDPRDPNNRRGPKRRK